MTLPDTIAPALQSALEKRGYSSLTPVQDLVLSHGQSNTDLLVSAQTGSGKTVAFGLAIAPTLMMDADRFAPRAEAPLALVVAPTRELAQQVCRELEWLYAPAGAKTLSCVGGMDMRTERRGLDMGPHIVVGTPGRLRDHIERGFLDLSHIKAVVLDEADEMLDMGFRDDLEFILDAAPKSRRTLLFSATVPKPIAALAKRYQRDAVRLATSEEKKQHVDISYYAHPVAPNDRENAIINLLRFYDAPSSLIFCSTRAEVNHLSSRLTNRGLSVVTLSGELSQRERSHALQAMRDGRARLCIATDVAARGIDLPSLDLVIHADLPKAADTFLHRSGRTGRAGRKGACALIVPYNRRRTAERLLGNARVDAKWGPPPSANDIISVIMSGFYPTKACKARHRTKNWPWCRIFWTSTARKRWLPLICGCKRPNIRPLKNCWEQGRNRTAIGNAPQDMPITPISRPVHGSASAPGKSTMPIRAGCCL
ncbi:hypothetical protein JCM17844_02810 [Iodidimonas gelatinilytica]|uniref:ATP-dependent RNA helicase n=1 Tax=Iodidimonas gelatinilytica TaxID=1236966 RepID=A0A5A7MLW7_9PROT|nr:DEAD/DEAH box helicase [Iodidimonas gelatinilytica]GEQ96644.1 hypothetical protein JCM17844_02810 [Iodidimonas gelatinilytica]